MPAVLDEGRVDAAVLIEPFVTAAMSTAKVLANLSDTMGGPYLISGWVANDDWIRRNADVVKRYDAVMRRAGIWANAHPKESADILIRYAKIRPELVAAMHRMHYSEGSTIDPATVQRPIDLLVRYGALVPFSAKDIIAAQ
jgi:NitT/TauT family transport system substrate-binding protein